MKNPQTTIALTFLTHINSDIDGVFCTCACACKKYMQTKPADSTEEHSLKKRLQYVLLKIRYIENSMSEID